MNRKIKYVIIIIFSVITITLGIINIAFSVPEFFKINMNNCIEIFILLFVSYYLVDRQNDENRHKQRTLEAITKIQDRLLDSELILVSNEEERNVTKVKLTSISNLLEILKDDLEDNNADFESAVANMDNLLQIVMDHINDESHIKKSNSDIVRLVTNIDTKLEKIKIDLN